MTPTRYDIYARSDGRWQKRDSLSGDDKDTALDRAGAMDLNGGFDGVRVMAVTEFGGGRPPLETLTWISPNLSKVASVSRRMKTEAAKAKAAVARRNPDDIETRTTSKPRPGPAPRAETVAPPSRPREDERGSQTRRDNASTPGRAIGSIFGNLALSLALSAISYVPALAILRSFGPGYGLDGAAQGRGAVTVALIVFVVATAATMSRVYQRHKSVFESLAGPATVGAPVPAASPSPRPMSEIPRIPVARDQARRSERVAHENRQEEADVPDAARSDGAKPERATLKEDMRKSVLAFLATALGSIAEMVPRMNRHVSFGLTLFGAGAAERFAELAGLGRMQSFVLIREVAGVLGNNEERIDAFCRNYGEYAKDERYRLMIESGKTAMSRHVEGDESWTDDFGAAVGAWTSDTAARARVQGIVCIMFTDIVGSTQMTHERGDYAAQDVVRVHNAIVRSALAAHHGREVKHTGDGIMASFTSPAGAVRAALEIRREVARHNAAQSAAPLGIRIGLNAGEAVEEEDDFFGTTVQLAARVCDKAAAGEAFVTDRVRVLADGQGLAFQEAGPFDMKGVPEPVPLFRVVDEPG